MRLADGFRLDPSAELERCRRSLAIARADYKEKWKGKETGEWKRGRGSIGGFAFAN